MELCTDCDSRGLCCDHCYYFNFNGDQQGRYTGNGYCILHNKKQEPDDCCDNYRCQQLGPVNKEHQNE